MYIFFGTAYLNITSEYLRVASIAQLEPEQKSIIYSEAVKNLVSSFYYWSRDFGNIFSGHMTAYCASYIAGRTQI